MDTSLATNSLESIIDIKEFKMYEAFILIWPLHLQFFFDRGTLRGGL